MPAHDGLWSNQYERRSPVRPDASQGHPKQPVTGLQAGPTVRPLHRHQLLAQRQVLQDHFAMSAECQRQRTTDDHQQLEHVSILAGAGARINSDEFWRGSGAARAHKVSMEPLSVAEYSEALEGMTQIFVKSSPAGGDVKVDNFAWRQKTNADGYAQAGDRLIAVTLGPATLTVTCKVEQDRPVTAQVDFDKRTAICQ